MFLMLCLHGDAYGRHRAPRVSRSFTFFCQFTDGPKMRSKHAIFFGGGLPPFQREKALFGSERIR